MSSKSFFYLFFVIILLGSSCSNQYFYVPEEVNLMQLSSKNSLKTSVSWNPTNRKQFRSFQVGYSPIKHLGIFASHFDIDQVTSYNNSLTLVNIDYTFQKIAIGGYYYFDFKQEKVNGLLFDIYAGIGKGEFNYSDVNTFGNYFIANKKYSLQTGIHWHRPFSSFSFVWQIGQTNHYKGSLNGQVQQDKVRIYNNVKTNPLFTTHESTIQYTLGKKGLRGYAFGSMILNYQEFFPEVFTGIGGVGIIVDIKELVQLIKNKKK